jgi:hypothetical protein
MQDNRGPPKLKQSPAVRFALFILGVIIMAIAPIIGLLPGPGGILVFAFGLALALRSSLWAKRRYVNLKRWQPGLGKWTDWGLRRPSARRRKERNKAEVISK